MEPRGNWPVQQPGDDFADRVMSRIAGEEPRAAGNGIRRSRSRARLAGAAAAVAVAAALALVVGWRGWHGHARGDAIAADRTQVAVGSRGVAVLERGAHVSWSGDDVTQPTGDVFYRVEPGGPFRVHTPGGDVEVLGTCFRVKVDALEGDMNGRDVKVAAVGAGVGAAVLVSVYEGKVALSRENARVALAAGESARADGTGVHRTGMGPDGALETDNGSGPAGDDPLLAANANLADTVREYKNRLDAIDAKKKALEKQLAEAQQKLAIALNDGQVPEPRSEFDLTQDDWKELAKEGEVRAKVPCLGTHREGIGRWAKELEKAGFSPQDAPTIKAAMDASQKRLWTTLRPLCVKALQGDAALVDKLGPMTCLTLVPEIAQQNGEDVDEELREVAEIRAGLRAVPSDGGRAVMKMWLAMSGESRAIEQDLAQSFGPQDAHRIVYDEAVPGCWNIMKVGGGPPPEH